MAEEPVALVEDEQAPHVTPPIPVHTPVAQEPVRAPVIEPVVAAPVVKAPEPAPAVVPVEPVRTEETKAGFFARLKQGLSKTSASIGEGMASLFLGKKAIDDELLDDLETRLLTADVGVEATSVIIQRLTQKVARKELADSDALYKSLQAELAAMPSMSPHLPVTAEEIADAAIGAAEAGAARSSTFMPATRPGWAP